MCSFFNQLQCLWYHRSLDFVSQTAQHLHHKLWWWILLRHQQQSWTELMSALRYQMSHLCHQLHLLFHLQHHVLLAWQRLWTDMSFSWLLPWQCNMEMSVLCNLLCENDDGCVLEKLTQRRTCVWLDFHSRFELGTCWDWKILASNCQWSSDQYWQFQPCLRGCNTQCDETDSVTQRIRFHLQCDI